MYVCINHSIPVAQMICIDDCNGIEYGRNKKGHLNTDGTTIDISNRIPNFRQKNVRYIFVDAVNTLERGKTKINNKSLYEAIPTYTQKSTIC